MLGTTEPIDSFAAITDCFATTLLRFTENPLLWRKDNLGGPNKQKAIPSTRFFYNDDRLYMCRMLHPALIPFPILYNKQSQAIGSDVART